MMAVHSDLSVKNVMTAVKNVMVQMPLNVLYVRLDSSSSETQQPDWHHNSQHVSARKVTITTQ
jgi:hypothetical protein